tara:strand:+ start:3608 stop:4210 length:603 start_codon:yes stop_codon:yes gene_type:complete
MAYRPIDLDRVRALYRPDFERGALVALVRVNRRVPAGREIIATPDQRSAYKRVTVGPDRLYLHRVLWALRYDRDPGKDMVVDHIDGDTRNNTIDNLRLCSQSENAKNRRTWSSTGLRGVYRRARAGGGAAYEVAIHRSETVDGVRVSRTHNFGTFSCPRAAKKAYLEAVDRFGDLDYLRDGQRGDGVEAIILKEYDNESA